jgi:hypothetical protein
VMLFKASLAVSLFQFGVYPFGYSQFEAMAALMILTSRSQMSSVGGGGGGLLR